MKKPIMLTDSAESIRSFYHDLMQNSETSDPMTADEVWKAGVLTLLAKIAFELETANGRD